MSSTATVGQVCNLALHVLARRAYITSYGVLRFIVPAGEAYS